MIQFQLGAPQIIIIVIDAVNLAVAAVHHGEPKEENYNVFISLIAFAIQLAILTWGGFF